MKLFNYNTFLLVLLLPTLYSVTPLVATAENRHVFLQPKKNNIALAPQSFKLLNGTWEGTYLCGQGLTKLKLIINAQKSTNIDAIFIFSAHASNPTVPSGSFKMKGVYKNLNSVDIPDTLELKATRWINRPSKYDTVDLQGNVSPSEKRIVGNVLNASNCSKFDVVKVKE